MTKRTTYLFLVLIVLTSCNRNKKQATTTNKIIISDNISKVINLDNKQKVSSNSSSILENKIIDTIFSLQEVKERQKYIEEQTKGKRHLQVWIADKPKITNKYYWIKVGEDNGTNLVTHFNFLVYPDLMQIMYYNAHTDKELSLDNWRK